MAMTPEEKQEFEALKAQVAKIASYSTSLGGSLEFKNIVKRYANELLTDELAVSAKTASSENQAVNEAGAATYSVLGVPDDFLKVTIGSQVYNLPSYDS